MALLVVYRDLGRLGYAYCTGVCGLHAYYRERKIIVDEQELSCMVEQTLVYSLSLNFRVGRYVLCGLKLFFFFSFFGIKVI